MKRHLVASTLLMCAGLLLTNFVLTTAWSQNANKDAIVKKLTRPDEPVEVTNLRVKGQPINFDSTFSRDEDWVKDLTVDVKNISNRDIIYINVALDFPLDESRSRIYRIALEYGHQPKSKGANSAVITPLKPGSVATLAVRSAGAEDLKSTLQTKGVGEALNISKAELFTEMVFFDERTMWSMGRMLSRDPVTNKWVATGYRIRPLKPGERTGEMRFEKTSGKNSTAIQYSCVKGEAFIVDCDCGNSRAITVAGVSSLEGGYPTGVTQLCDPGNRSCGNIEYEGVAGYCRTAE